MMQDINKLEQMYKAGAISRREFMKRSAAIGMVLAGSGIMAAGSAQAAPKKGGRLRQGIGNGATTDSLDPGTHNQGFTHNLVCSYANSLTEVDGEGNLIPELAESYEGSVDAKTWIFKLRKGIEFHNGKTLTTDDVLASINFHRGKNSKSVVKELLNPIESIRKDGNNTIVFELKSGSADFPFLMSDYHIPILPEKDGRLDWAAGIGTGGYILQNYEPGVRAEFKRNPNYWKPGRAHFDEVENIAILDATARQNAIMNGDVDVINTVDPKIVHLLTRVPNLKILEVAGLLHYTFPMRVNVKPFDNPDLRMAIKLSVNRQEMVKKILSGHGTLGNDHPISASNRHHASNLPQRAYDPEKAKYFLKKSGMEGVNLQLSASDVAFAGAVDAALLLKASAAKIGVNIDVVQEPKDGYWSNVWNKKPWCTARSRGRATTDWMLSLLYIRDQKWNDTAWREGPEVDRFNELVEIARTELDEAKRKALYVEAQTILHNHGGAVIPMFANHIMALSKKIGHDKAISGNAESDGNKSAERWWFV